MFWTPRAVLCMTIRTIRRPLAISTWTNPTVSMLRLTAALLIVNQGVLLNSPKKRPRLKLPATLDEWKIKCEGKDGNFGS